MQANEDAMIWSFDRWDHSCDWWWPNTTAPGDHDLPATHGQAWPRVSAARWDYLSDHPGVRWHATERLWDTKHLHVACLHETEYFRLQRDLGFSRISHRVLRDCRQGTCRLVLLMPYEASSGHGQHASDLDILDDWCLRWDLPRDAVWLVNGDHALICDGRRFQHVAVSAFRGWIPWSEAAPLIYDPSDSRDLFVSYNRRARVHRDLLMTELCQRDLLPRGLVTWHGSQQLAQNMIAMARYDLQAAAEKLQQAGPLLLDVTDAEHNPAGDLNTQHHAQTFLSLVTETQATGALFASEKTWRPLALGHPFIMLGSTGHMQWLRQQGYRTWSRWWDESYDQEPNLHLRISKALDQLQQLSTLSRSQLSDMRAEMLPDLTHNQSLFRQQRASDIDTHGHATIYRVMRNIWDGF